MMKKILFIIGILSLLVLVGCNSESDYDKGYESGYFHGWHESLFMDCTLPEINQSMRIVYYNDVDGSTEELIIPWEDVCKRIYE